MPEIPPATHLGGVMLLAVLIVIAVGVLALGFMFVLDRMDTAIHRNPDGADDE